MKQFRLTGNSLNSDNELKNNKIQKINDIIKFKGFENTDKLKLTEPEIIKILVN